MAKAIVIGSGFGGLGIAARLQTRGFDVTIMEKNSAVGGHAAQLKKQGYTFDMGPSLVTAPDIIGSVFRSAGRRLEDYVEMIRLDPFYRIYFHDGNHIDYSGDPERMKSQMAEFHPGDAANYDRFMDDCRRIYEAVIVDGLGSTPFISLRTMLEFLPRAVKLKALLPAYSFVKRYFEHPYHRFTFSFHPLFIGGNPFRAPGVYLMIPYLEKTGGVWFTRGGMYALVQAFERLFMELGGRIETGSPVQEIRIENGKATGVIAGGRFHRADLVVSNADIVHTHRDLLGSGHPAKRFGEKTISMSAFLIYLGVKKQYPQLLHHTLILSERYRGLVRDIFDNRILPEDFSMYLHAPTRTDPSMAPSGSESMYVLIPVSNLSGDINWQQMAGPFADRVISFLESGFGLTGLKANIEVREIFTPEDFRVQRNSFLGSPWGIEPRLTRTAYFRPHNRSSAVANLYFVGAGTHPGAGLPGVLLSAEATEKLVLRDFKIYRTEKVFKPEETLS